MFVPSWLMPLCSTSEPKFTRLDISPIDSPLWYSETTLSLENTKCSLAMCSIGKPWRIRIRQSTTDSSCETSVATAAPRTPMPKTRINR